MTTRTTPEPDDRDLLRCALDDPDGDVGRRAASDLLARYQRRVYLWCYRYVRDHERALDMAQEVLMKAYGSLATFDRRAEFSSWMFAIARNRCLSELRRPSLALDDLADPDAGVSPLPGPDIELLDRLDEEALLDLIKGRLEPVERSALWLRCFEKLSVDDITAMLKIDEASGARAILQRARRKLVRALDERRLREGAGGS